MSWELNYHRQKLESITGRKWVPKPKADSLAAAHREEQRARAKLGAAQKANELLSALLLLALLAFVSGIGLVVWSSLNGVDAGTAAGALIGSGIPLALTSTAGNVWIALNVLPDLEDAADVAQAVLDQRVADEIGGAA